MPQLVAAWDRVMWLEVVAEPFAAPRPVLRRRSVLEPPATEADIAAAEQRIGLPLPPSYRAFLTRSDGAYAGSCGLQHRHPTDRPRPLALLPAAAIDRSFRWFTPWPVDELLLAGSEPLPHGGDALFAPSPPGRHSGLTDLATHLAGRSPEFRAGHLGRSITIGLDHTETLVLDPTVRDGDGEWAVWAVSSQGCGPFHPSFAHWLRWRTQTGTLDELDVDDLVQTATDPESTVWAALGALTTLIQRRERTEWVEGQLTTILRHAADNQARRRALVLCRSLDLVDGGDRFGAWTARIVADDTFADVEVLSLVDHRIDSAPAPPGGPPDSPSGAEVADGERRVDLAHLGDVSSEVLAGRYERAPDPIVGHFLAQRGHPAVVSGALGELLRRADAVDHWLPNGPFPTTPDPTMDATPDELLAVADAAGEEYHLIRPINVGLALARAGHAEDAVEYLHAARSGLEGFRLLYPIAEIDIRRSWEILDEAAQTDPEHATTVNTTGLLAAARTRSPLLADRATQLIVDDAAVAPIALLALELQSSPSAAEALLALWHQRGHLGALRALARRGDHRVLDDCRLLLADPDPELRQVGAETLRHLGHPATIDLLTSGVGLDDQPLMVALQADALVSMGVTAAAPDLDRAADRIGDPDLARVLTVWADQLRRRSEIDDRRHRGS